VILIPNLECAVATIKGCFATSPREVHHLNPNDSESMGVKGALEWETNIHPGSGKYFLRFIFSENDKSKDEGWNKPSTH
jgi:hypothetical protein